MSIEKLFLYYRELSRKQRQQVLFYTYFEVGSVAFLLLFFLTAGTLLLDDGCGAGRAVFARTLLTDGLVSAAVESAAGCKSLFAGASGLATGALTGSEAEYGFLSLSSLEIFLANLADSFSIVLRNFFESFPSFAVTSVNSLTSFSLISRSTDFLAFLAKAFDLLFFILFGGLAQKYVNCKLMQCYVYVNSEIGLNIPG